VHLLGSKAGYGRGKPHSNSRKLSAAGGGEGLKMRKRRMGWWES
jgi:hypothetical protein